jgi:hypothetical protein
MREVVGIAARKVFHPGAFGDHDDAGFELGVQTALK